MSAHRVDYQRFGSDSHGRFWPAGSMVFYSEADAFHYYDMLLRNPAVPMFWVRVTHPNKGVLREYKHRKKRVREAR